MTKIQRKFCHLHGWAPHRVYRYSKDLPVEDFVSYKACCRCHPPEGLTRSAKIKAFFRGFKLPESVSTKVFLNGRFG